MSKHETFAEYPPRGLAAAEAALLTMWPTLNRYHHDLVLVGGLAVHYLTRRDSGDWPSAVTMDVDFGISLAAEGGQYGTVQSDLAGLGFKPDKEQPKRFSTRGGKAILRTAVKMDHPIPFSAVDIPETNLSRLRQQQASLPLQAH